MIVNRKGQVTVRYYGLYANAERPPPPQFTYQEVLTAAETAGELFP